MSFLDIAQALSEGNPGAITVLLGCFHNAAKIDPQSVLGWLGPISQFDNLDIYGSKIWILYKDICRENLSYTIALMRANQLGILANYDIRASIEAHEPTFNLDEVLQKVSEELSEFNFDPEGTFRTT